MPPNKSFDAVLFDFGGVITSSPFAAFNRYEVEHGLPKDFIRHVNTTNPTTNAWARFESSQISADEFDVAFLNESRDAGHALPGSDIIALLSGELRPRMVEALKICKKHYRIACLTNNVKSGNGPGMSLDTVKTQQISHVMSLFDVVVESSKEGVRKPQPEFYLRACEKLRLDPRRAVFLDDLGINLKPARKLGMTTIKVLDEAQALRDLASTLNLADLLA